MRNLTARILIASAGVLFQSTGASSALFIEIDPGAVGETFATKSFDLPDLVGTAASDEVMELNFAFADDKFVNSSIFFAGDYTLQLVVQYDRPFADNQVLNSFPFDPFVRGFGHVTDENGNRLNYPGSFASFGPALPVVVRVGPDRPEGSGPSGATTSDAYYGAFMRYDFFFPVGDDPPIIESATLSFLDPRDRWPNPAPLPHVVGQASLATVPEPLSIVTWAGLAIVTGGIGWLRRQKLK